MRMFSVLFVACSLSLHTLQFGEAKLLRPSIVRNLEEVGHLKQPLSNAGGSVSDGSGSSSGGQSSGGGSSSGGSGSGGSETSSGKQSSGGGSANGGSTQGSDESSSAKGSLSSSSQYDVESASDVRSKVGIIGLASVAVLVSALLAAATLRRKTTVKAAHPLKGSINRRMDLFSDMAKHNPSASRPPRRVEDVYVPAPDGGAGV